MEYWRQCALWLISCKVLPPNHRVTGDAAQVFDLAQTLRDGVLLCQLLNNLRPQTINLKEINLRPQMSQFLCLKNIRTFLTSCCDTFGMKKTDLFEAFDLFDVRDFGKRHPVERNGLGKIFSTFIWNLIAAPFFDSKRVCVCFSENGSEDDEDLYSSVYGIDISDDGGEIYEDLMRTEPHPTLKQAEQSVRSCCLSEIKQTEERYTETLESIEKVPATPLHCINHFIELVKVHKCLMVEVHESIVNKNALNLYQIFISYKERLLIYGVYCSHVERSIAVLDSISKEKEDVGLKLKECSKRANNGKFTLRDLLVVPMQRVLKYHLLLQELVKHTPDAADKDNLKMALDAMKDLAQYVNEVKRDKETLREIDQYQRSIENLNQSLASYGRPKGDGEVRIISNVDKRKQDRHIFLFDVAVIICKRRGDVYEMKDVIDLNYFKITNNPTQDRESKKWCYGFYLTHQQGQSGFEFIFKTKELKKKWLDQFDMALSNIRPGNANNNSHQFRMHTFDRITTCSACHLLLRGIFNQGYMCVKCGLGAHKECLGRLGICGKTGKRNLLLQLGLPKMVVIKDYCGIPPPQTGSSLTIHAGDIIELICADLHSSWWQVPKPVDYSTQLWFAGPMERHQAEVELMDRENSTYLIRHRTRELQNWAVRVCVLSCMHAFLIMSCVFAPQELVEYYKQHSLREGFRTLDTTLEVPFRESVFSPRVLGIAVARYDFCSRDTREICLQEGDVVQIYTKMSNGWWRGGVNGRVGWFPSTYVEEED
uniref:Vav 3 guanine nucleotide exchange factor b n=1 Tax=Esox lucius TaxID=8010 RepID=A0A6Q2YQ49_ESOLU